MKKEILTSIKSTFENVKIASQGDIETLFSGCTPDMNMSSLREWAIFQKDIEPKAFDRALRCWKVKECLGDYPTDVQVFIDLYIRKWRISAAFNGQLRKPSNGVALDFSALDATRELRLLNDQLGLRFAARSIEDAFEQWITQARQARFQECWNAITVDVGPNADADWEAWAEATIDTSKVSAAYAIAVIKTFLWQVKRKMADDKAFPVHHHLMPVLTGNQEAGKSSASLALFAPLRDLVLEVNFAAITDTKNFGKWSFPILFVDEMAAAERADIEAVKRAITCEAESERAHGKHSNTTSRNRATLWGCSNKPLSEKIADTTGMRRFGPLPFRHPPTRENKAQGLNVVDWDVVNNTDYIRLWQSVDHRQQHPLQSDPASLMEWKELIENERARDSVEEWLRSFQPEPRRGPYRPATDLYPLYRTFCEATGQKACALQTLGKRMRAYVDAEWFPFGSPRTASGNVTVWDAKTTNGNLISFPQAPSRAQEIAHLLKEKKLP